jgi:hypothetical protein
MAVVVMALEALVGAAVETAVEEGAVANPSVLLEDNAVEGATGAVVVGMALVDGEAPMAVAAVAEGGATVEVGAAMVVGSVDSVVTAMAMAVAAMVVAAETAVVATAVVAAMVVAAMVAVAVMAVGEGAGAGPMARAAAPPAAGGAMVK